MHILILISTKLKANSYAENLYQSLLSFFSSKNYSILNFETLQQANKQIQTENNTVIIVQNRSNTFRFFADIALRSFLKKKNIQYLIQITGDTVSRVNIHQLIISNNIEKFRLTNGISDSTKVAVSSEHSKEKIKDATSIGDKNLAVIPFSANVFFSPISWSEKQSLKVEYTQGREYFFVYAKEKTKAQVLSLLKAFSAFKKWQHSSMKLIIEGNILFSNDDDWKEKLSTYKYREDVVFTSQAEEETTSRLLAGAYVFIHTPISEDDVLPLLQAIQCNTPCISFTTDIIKQYAGNAALLIEANNYELLGDKMILLYKDENLRSQIIDAGIAQSKLYSKEKVAAILNDVLLKSADVQTKI